MDKRGGYRFCFCFVFCVLFLHLQYLRGVRRVLGKLVSTPAPGIAQPWDRARGGGGAEHVLGVRRWNSLGLGEPPSPLPPRAGRPRQPLEDAVTAKAPCWEPRWPACDLQGPLRTHASRNRKKWYPAPSGHVKAASGTGGGEPRGGREGRRGKGLADLVRRKRGLISRWGYHRWV